MLSTRSCACCALRPPRLKQRFRYLPSKSASSHESVQRGKARRASVGCAPNARSQMGAAGSRLPRVLGEEAVSVHLSGVSLPVRSARRCRAPGCLQTIQGSSGKPSKEALCRCCRRGPCWWCMILISGAHVKIYCVHVCARASGCMNVCRGSSRLRRECRAQANRLRIWVQGLRQSIPWKWLVFRLKKRTMSMRVRMSIMRYLVHIQSMRATGIESFPELTPAGSK